MNNKKGIKKPTTILLVLFLLCALLPFISYTVTAAAYVDTNNATGVGGYNATLRGNLTSDGGEGCITGFEYGLTTSYGNNMTALPTYIYAGGATTLKIFKYWVSNMTKKAETITYGGQINALVENDTYIYAGGANSTTAANARVKKYLKSTMALSASTSVAYGGAIYALAIDDTYIYAGGATNQSIKQYYKSNMTLKKFSVKYGGDIRAIVVDSTYVYIAGVLTNRVRQYWKSNLTYKAQSPALLPGAAVYGLAQDTEYIYAGGETNTVSKFWKSNMTRKVNASVSYGDIVFVIAIDDTYIYVGGGTQMTVKQYWKSNMTYKGQTPSYGWTTRSVAVDSTYLYVGETTGNTVRQYYKYNLALKKSTATYGGTTYAISSLTDKYVTGNTFSFNSTGLTPLTTYHYRAYAINSAGKSVGEDKTFTTTSATPVVTTNAAKGITAVNATLQGTLTEDGGLSCNVRFQYGLTVAYGTNSTNQTGKSKGSVFYFNATGLMPLTLYHYRTYANNSVGGVVGEDKTFTTLNPPIVYVDDNAAPGWYNDAAHVKTIKNAVTNVSNGGTIYVYGGTYPEALVSGSYITIASKTITIIGEQADIPKIRPLMSNSSAQKIFSFTGSRYTLTLQYLNISNRWGGATTPVHMGIDVPAQNNLIVDHCILHDVNQVIKNYGNITFTNNTVYNFKYRVVEGSWSAATYALRMIIRNNIIYDSVTGGTGETLKAKYGHWYGDISYNYICGNRIGIWIDPEPGIVCKFGGNWTIAHNTIDSRYNPANPGNTSQGIVLTSVTGNFNKITIRDNIVNGANYYSIYHGGFANGEPFATSTLVKNCLFNNSYRYWPYATGFGQVKYQWNGTGYSTSVNYTAGYIHTVAGWKNSTTSGYLFNFSNCQVADPMFNLTGAPGPEYWGLRYGSPAVGTASDGGNIGCWQGTPTGGHESPHITLDSEHPVTNSTNVSLTLSQISCNLTEDNGYLMDWNITTVPSIGSGGEIDVYNKTITVNVSGLQPNTLYTWYVNVTDGTTWANKTFYFTTETEKPPVNIPPGLSNENPSNGTTNMTYAFDWNLLVNDTNGDLMNISIECSSGHSISYSNVSNNTYALSLSSLAANTTYVVWVNATDGLVETKAWYQFTTMNLSNTPPDKPTNEQPTNNTLYTSVYGKYLNVTVSDPDNDTLTVYFYWSNDTAIAFTTVDSGDVASIYLPDYITPDWLVHDITYGWYANASDGSETTQSDIWNFHTSKAWDIDEDTHVDGADVSILVYHYGDVLIAGSQGWDIDNDGQITAIDISGLVIHYSESY